MLFTAASQEPVFSPFSTTLIFASVAVSLAFIYWYGYGRYQHFRKDGLKGPKPAPFLGSTLDLARSKWQLHLMLDVYYKKYGRVFGVYLNSSPAVVVSDPDMVKQILVKDFSKFHDRQVIQKIYAMFHNKLAKVTMSRKIKQEEISRGFILLTD